MTHEAGILETPAPENGMGWYLYAVLPWCSELAGTAGIEEGRPAVFIPEGSIMAVASPVSLTVFDSEPIRRHMEDSRWLAEKVYRHEAVVEAMMARGPVLPMKFCTIFRSPDAIRRMLREHAARFQEALEFVRGKEEWGVKGFIDRRGLREAALRRDPELCDMAEQLDRSESKRPGTAFFLKRRLDDLAEQRRIERETELIRAALEALRGSVAEFANNLPPGGQGAAEGRSASLMSGRAGEEMVLDMACLVLKEEVQTFLAEIQQWAESERNRSLRLEASGPWPPYNFSQRLGNHAR